MRTDSSHERRFEWKYRVPSELIRELIPVLQRDAEPDAHCLAGDGTYFVRSLYYDTCDLRFYHETKDGLKVRRKLRVRHYGDNLYFLEIKRKIDKEVVKERVSVCRSQVAHVLRGADPAVLMAGRPYSDLRTLERFRFNVESLGLIPTALVTYRRLALVGRSDPRLRITLDSNLRGQSHPGPEALFEDGALLAFGQGSVLELKFGRPPRWLIEILSEFRLRRQSYSKYSEGIDCCANGLHQMASARAEVPRS